MNVFVVKGDDYEDVKILGIFSTLELAEKWVNTNVKNPVDYIFIYDCKLDSYGEEKLVKKYEHVDFGWSKNKTPDIYKQSVSDSIRSLYPRASTILSMVK